MFTLVHCLFTCRTTDLCLIFHIYPPFRKKVMEHRVTDKYFTTMDAALSDKGTFIAPQLHPLPSTIMVQYVSYLAWFIRSYMCYCLLQWSISFIEWLLTFQSVQLNFSSMDKWLKTWNIQKTNENEVSAPVSIAPALACGKRNLCDETQYQEKKVWWWVYDIWI